LIVLDNADDPELLFSDSKSHGIIHYLPESEGTVTFLTTRTPDVSQWTPGAVIELEVMGRQDARHFLAKSLNSKDDPGTAIMLRDELLNELTCLPLAIAQAAAYLNKNRMSIPKYLHLLRNTEEDLVQVMGQEFRDATRYKASANAVARTWVVSFIQIERQNPAAADLLRFMSCIE
jgi:hypothetical protein